MKRKRSLGPLVRCIRGCHVGPIRTTKDGGARCDECLYVWPK